MRFKYETSPSEMIEAVLFFVSDRPNTCSGCVSPHSFPFARNYPSIRRVKGAHIYTWAK